MKQTYKNSLRSKKLIREALIYLLAKTNDLNKIGISDVVKQADINRGTFYNHYNNISDVLNEIKDELIEKLTQTINESLKENSIPSFIDSISNYVKENEKIYRVISPHISRAIITDMKNSFINNLKNLFPYILLKDEQKTNLDIISYGMAGVYLDYLEGRLNITLNELAEYTKKLLERII